MNYEFESDLAQYSTVMADALKQVAEDLRTIDLLDVVSFIRFGSYATIEDLLQSSTEMFFKSGILNFGWTAAVELGWSEPPAVTVGMEFRHRAVTVFFDLTLRPCDESVNVVGIQFDEPAVLRRDKLRQLAEALADARRPTSSNPAGPVRVPPIGRAGP